jgi:hypothetical protein
MLYLLVVELIEPGDLNTEDLKGKTKTVRFTTRTVPYNKFWSSANQDVVTKKLWGVAWKDSLNSKNATTSSDADFEEGIESAKKMAELCGQELNDESEIGPCGPCESYLVGD